MEVKIEFQDVSEMLQKSPLRAGLHCTVNSDQGLLIYGQFGTPSPTPTDVSNGYVQQRIQP